MYIKHANARDVLVGLFKFIPNNYFIHLDDISRHLTERYDVSAREIRENLDILCGKYHHPIILKVDGGYYTVFNKKTIEKFIEPNFNEEQLKDFENLAKGILKEFSNEIRLKV